LDIKINKDNKKEISINGWQDNTNIFLEDMLEYFSDTDLKYVLCTDISKDGTLLGPNVSLYREIVQKFPNIYFQASGGVSQIQDIINLRNSGVKNIIIGRSLLEKKFTIQEAMRC
ncbi:MAG: HisA/HisF-related TIM barrel protein, partial [Buchnera aphidicola]|nr:1-(5-phosphoribosyl)-5-((5-phosphoribosylamino)methylideneamino)imidazole-4-carboxamide isomerase [Buchnera aphidicola]MDE5285495.1 HisA/HisF-related TIM barrel protein [Buchnera aphidicola]